MCIFIILKSRKMTQKYIVQASDGKSTYVVTVLATQCCEQPNCVPQCTASECTYLCRHQISCTCWDYSEGHLCKHCHKVRAVSSGACSDANDCSSAEDPISSSFVFNPESCSGGKAGLISRSKVQTAFYIFNSGRMIYS